MKRTLQTLALLLLLCSVASAQDTQRRNLAGLRGVVVVTYVGDQEPLLLRLIDEVDIRAAVERQLRHAGLNVGTVEQLIENPPSLHVAVAGMRCGDTVVYHLGVSLYERGMTARRPGDDAKIISWEREMIGAANAPGQILEAVKRVVEEFLNDWEAMRPQKNKP